MSYEAEKDTIGCLLINEDAIEKVYGILSPEKFENPTLGRVYYEIKKAYDNGQKIDERLICFQMADIDSEFLLPLLIECANDAPLTVNVEKYARQINNEWKVRQLGNLMNINPEANDIDEQLKSLEKSLSELQSDRVSSQQTMADLVRQNQDQRFNEDKPQGIKFNMRELDDILNGVDGGDIFLLCARPAVGKTAFMLQMALGVAKQGKTAHIFSLEMTNAQIYDRLVAHESGISMARIRRATNYLGEEEKSFTGANKTLEELPIVFNDDIYKVSEMKQEIKKSKADIVFIDYAQLLRPESNYKGNRMAEVGQISHSLKQLAKELNIPFVVLCQLNRVVDETREPSMNEIRESGDFEQDASIITLLWNTNDDRTEKGVKVDKNRSGETGKYKTGYDGKTFTFGTLFKPKEEETPFDTFD